MEINIIIKESIKLLKLDDFNQLKVVEHLPNPKQT